MLQKIAQGLSLAVVSTALVPPSSAQAQPPRPRPPHHRPAPPGPVVINHYESNGSGLAASAFGFGAGLLVGAAASSPPLMVSPPPTVIVAQPAPLYLQPAPPTVVQVQAPPSDVVGSALKMLNSHWAATRRDGAILLGRQRARQAVGPLMDRLRNDKDSSVRKTAAWSLAEIGDTSALDYLEKTSQFDKSPEVQAAAKTAHQRLIEKVALATPVPRETGQISTTSRPTRDPLAQPPAPPLPGASPPISKARISKNPNPSPTTSPSPFANTQPALEAPLSLSPPIQPLTNP